MFYDIALSNCVYVIIMAVAFHVILETEEEDANRPRLKNPRVFRDGYIYLFNNHVIEMNLV